jgi:alpha-glucosidase
LRAESGSILHLYQRLLALRRDSAALREGGFRWLDTPDGVLGYERAAAEDRWIVLVNFGDDDAAVPVDELDSPHVEIASDGMGEGARFTGRLTAEQAVVLRPRPG